MNFYSSFLMCGSNMQSNISIPTTREEFYNVIHKDPVFIPWLKKVISYYKVSQTYYDPHNAGDVSPLIGLIITIFFNTKNNMLYLNHENFDLDSDIGYVWASPVEDLKILGRCKNKLIIRETKTTDHLGNIEENLYLTRGSCGCFLDRKDMAELFEGKIITGYRECCLYVPFEEIIKWEI